MDHMVQVEGLDKSFVLHNQGGTQLRVLENFELALDRGEIVVLQGPSGAGKSSLLRLLYGNYKADSGTILVSHGNEVVDIVRAEPHKIIEVRRRTIGYVSQFLRVIPRVPALHVVMEPLRILGEDEAVSREKAEILLTRLRIPKRLWSLSPTTFSGGEQQRINIARSFIACRPIMLLDEPTASLDPENKKTVVDLILEAQCNGIAMLGVFHEKAVQDAVASRAIDLKPVMNGNN
jgi:alpha-D-ribose 1-methylphosphonate 5-triphosphate synthase subunit PhnL